MNRKRSHLPLSTDLKFSTMRVFLSAIALSVVVFGSMHRRAVAASGPADGRPMNVVFILADDLG